MGLKGELSNLIPLIESDVYTGQTAIERGNGRASLSFGQQLVDQRPSMLRPSEADGILSLPDIHLNRHDSGNRHGTPGTFDEFTHVGLPLRSPPQAK